MCVTRTGFVSGFTIARTSRRGDFHIAFLSRAENSRGYFGHLRPIVVESGLAAG
jgi:hypothetical protein